MDGLHAFRRRTWFKVNWLVDPSNRVRVVLARLLPVALRSLKEVLRGVGRRARAEYAVAEVTDPEVVDPSKIIA